MPERDPHSIAFPKLSDAELESLGKCPATVRKTFAKGSYLFHAGDRDVHFYVVTRGEVEILDVTGAANHSIALHTIGQFSGDVSQITGDPAIVTGIAKTDCEVLEVSPEALRQLINHHPELGDVILQAFIARRQLLRDSGTFTGLRVVGSRDSKDTFRIRDFLSKNRVMFTWIDLDSDPAVSKLLETFGVSESDTPIVACSDSMMQRNPSNLELAEAIGIRREIPDKVYDLIIVGAGPAGLAAAVYGASEGLDTLVLERTGPGGQAGRSMRIENYLGFPVGISGSELADRAVMQASKFGARLPVPTPVISLSFDGKHKCLKIDGNECIRAKTLLIATGAEYRLLDVEGCEQLEGCGVYYAATPNEAQMCRGSDVIIVGGGNSAGQAATFLSSQVSKVYLLIRGDDLNKSMSSYLVQRITDHPKIEVIYNSEVQRLHGSTALKSADIVNRKTGETRSLKIPALFSFIGAVPRTDWLPPEIECDPKRFVCTGPAVEKSLHWSAKRTPFYLETSVPGVFAVGDVRAGSIKRVASAVGEGSMAVQFVHECMKEF